MDEQLTRSTSPRIDARERSIYTTALDGSRFPMATRVRTHVHTHRFAPQRVPPAPRPAAPTAVLTVRLKAALTAAGVGPLRSASAERTAGLCVDIRVCRYAHGWTVTAWGLVGDAMGRLRAGHCEAHNCMRAVNPHCRGPPFEGQGLGERNPRSWPISGMADVRYPNC